MTLADSASADRIAAALTALDRFAVVATVDRVVLLEERRGRVWSSLADAALGPPAVVGRGGLALEITRGRILDPEVRPCCMRRGRIGGVAADAGSRPAGSVGSPRSSSPPAAKASVAGVAAAWRADDGGHVAVCRGSRGAPARGSAAPCSPTSRRPCVAAGWDCPVAARPRPAGFYRPAAAGRPERSTRTATEA